MSKRSDTRENRPADEVKAGQIKTENTGADTHTMTREELLASDPKAREMYVKLRNLRSSVDAIKDHTVELSAEEMKQAISDSRKSATSETARLRGSCF